MTKPNFSANLALHSKIEITGEDGEVEKILSYQVQVKNDPDDRIFSTFSGLQAQVREVLDREDDGMASSLNDILEEYPDFGTVTGTITVKGLPLDKYRVNRNPIKFKAKEQYGNSDGHTNFKDALIDIVKQLISAIGNQQAFNDIELPQKELEVENEKSEED